MMEHSTKPAMAKNEERRGVMLMRSITSPSDPTSKVGGIPWPWVHMWYPPLLWLVASKLNLKHNTTIAKQIPKHDQLKNKPRKSASIQTSLLFDGQDSWVVIVLSCILGVGC
jgi:hypothetical protein